MEENVTRLPTWNGLENGNGIVESGDYAAQHVKSACSLVTHTPRGGLDWHTRQIFDRRVAKSVQSRQSIQNEGFQW